jgi:hypothetical protein
MTLKVVLAEEATARDCRVPSGSLPFATLKNCMHAFADGFALEHAGELTTPVWDEVSREK